MKWLVVCALITGCAEAAPPNAIIGGLIDGGRGNGDGGRDNGGTFDPDASTIDAPPDVVTFSQTASNMVLSNNSVGCINTSANTSYNNSYYRVFTPSDTGVTGALHLTKIDFGIELASSASGSQSATLKIGAYVGDKIDANTAVLTGTTTNISTTPITIKDTDSPTAMSVPVSADIAPNSTFIVELNVPASNSQFYIGSNTGTETKPGYTSASDCGYTKPNSYTSIVDANPNANLGTITIVMSATGTSTR